MPSSLNVDSGDAAQPQKPVRRLVTRIYLTALRLFIVTIALAPVRTGATIDDTPCPCSNGAVPASCSSKGAGSAFRMSACSSLRYRATSFIFRCGESLINSPLSPDVHDIDNHVDRSSIAFDTCDLWGGSLDSFLPDTRVDVVSYSFSTDIDAAHFSFKMLTILTPSHNELVLRVFDNLVTDDINDDDKMMTLATWLEPTTRDVAEGFVALPAYTGHGVVTHAICTGPREGVHNKELLI